MKKTIEVTLEEVTLSQSGINQLTMLKLPIKTAWNISKLADEITKHTKHFNNAKVNAAKQFGKPSDKIPGAYDFPENSDREKFDKAMEELLAEKVTIKNFFELNLSDLGDIQIEPKALMSLQWLIKD